MTNSKPSESVLVCVLVMRVKEKHSYLKSESIVGMLQPYFLIVIDDDGNCFVFLRKMRTVALCSFNCHFEH